MKNSFYQTEFTFHSSWMAAMSFIRSKSVRNRLTAAIIEYGLNRTHTPIGNSVADAIMVLVMDQIDRECGGNDKESSLDKNSDTLSPDCETILDGEEDGDRPECGEDKDIQETYEPTTATEVPSHENAADSDDGGADLSAPVGITVRAKRKSKSIKKKRHARRRKHRRIK